MPRRGSSGISKQMRLRQRVEFLAVQSGGAKLHGRHVLAIAKRVSSALPGGAAIGPPPGTQTGIDVDPSLRSGRLGLTVTKKVGNAVVRNRIKRLLREWMRRNGWVPAGWDLVLVAKGSAARQLHPDDFAADLTRILRQLS